MAGRFAAIAFEQRHGLADRLMLATSTDGGRHWSAAREPLPNAPGTQEWPAITIDRRGRITLAWSKKLRVYFAQGVVAKGKVARFGPERPLDPRAAPGVPQWKPALALGGGGVVHAAFVDARTKFADSGLPQAGIYYTRIRGRRPGAARRLDDGKAAKLAARMDNAWSPSVAVSGKHVLVGWIDFQNYDWDVMSRLSGDGGASFAKQVDSNPQKADAADENLSDSPKALFTRAGPLLAWTDFHKRDPTTRVHPLYDTYVAAPGKKPTQVDPYGGQQVSTFWPAACAEGKDVIVAFQDSATGVANVKITRVHGGKKRGDAFLLSDAPSGGSYRPAIGCNRGRFVAAWEDMRDGPPRIYVSRGRLP
jgi:hypothetical protein